MIIFKEAGNMEALNQKNKNQKQGVVRKACPPRDRNAST